MKWKTTLLLGAIILISLWAWHSNEKRHAVKVSDLNNRIVQLESSVKTLNKVAEVEAHMRDSLVESLGALNEDYNSISVALNDANRLLKQFKTAPTSNTEPTSVTCTRDSPELYREDAEFLIKEAGRADKILKERDFYYDRYEHARRALEALKRGAS